MAFSRKNNKSFYSTDPNYRPPEEIGDETVTLPNNQQRLYVMLDRKMRRGKEVTIVTGFEGKEQDLKDLGRNLKSKCGVGGSVKDGQILIQGNNKDKVYQILKDQGYTQTRTSGR